jgi:hypothetical protein
VLSRGSEELRYSGPISKRVLFFRSEIPGGVKGLTLAPGKSCNGLVRSSAGFGSGALTQIVVELIERERLWFDVVIIVV